MSPKTKGILWLVTSAFAFAAMGSLVRLCDECGEAVSCFQKGFFRNAIAFLIALAVFMRTLSAKTLPPKRVWGYLILRSLFGTVGIFANFYALAVIPVADGQALNKTAPFFTVLFAWMFLGEKASRRQIAAIATAFIGMLLVVRPGFGFSFAGEAVARFWGIAGGVFAGAAYATLRKLALLKTDGAFVVLFFSAFSCLAAVPFTVAEFTPMNGAQIAVMLSAGAAAAVGQFGITLAYKFAAPKEIAVFDYTSIIFAALMGFSLFGQIPDFMSVIGFVVIIAAAFRLR